VKIVEVKKYIKDEAEAVEFRCGLVKLVESIDSKIKNKIE